VSNTPGGTSTFRETITTFYESAQLDSGEPNTLGFSNTLPNSIRCVSNYPFIMGNQLTKKERVQVTDLLIKYENVFAFSMKDLGRCKTMQFSIDLINETLVYRRKLKLSKHEWELVDERCKELHEVGLIQPSSFDFTAITVMPTKKDSVGLWTEKRMCGDYRPLNLITPQDRYPMPIPEKLFDNIGDSNIFTICGFEARFQLDYARYEGSQENNIPWKQQVMGMACDAFWIKECIYFLSASHGPSSRKGRFPEVLHR
jgi:hypothetical protein